MLVLYNEPIVVTEQCNKTEKKIINPYQPIYIMFVLALSSFIRHCPALLSDDIIRRVMIPLESCVAMTAQ